MMDNWLLDLSRFNLLLTIWIGVGVGVNVLPAKLKHVGLKKKKGLKSDFGPKYMS